MLGKIESLAVVGPASIRLTWDDGHEATIDLAEVVGRHAALDVLRATDFFAKVRVSDDGWSVEWPGGVDFGAPQLRRWADEQAGEIMPVAAFRAWLDRHRLTQEQAATALGLSRRMIAYYLSGEKPIPKTVMLATVGYAAQRAA